MLSKNIEHVLLDTHDEADNAFRVKVSGVDVNVTAETDSIKIGDEDGNLVTTTTVSGTVQALDVVVHDIAIDAANDSIALGDGVDQVTVANFVGKTALEVSVIQSASSLISLIDEPDASTLYVGEALPGSGVTSAVWRIKKVLTSGTVTSILYADGDFNFNNVWNNRTALSYS